MFKIEMWPAGHGDCLYIEYGEPAAPKRVLIDAGPYYAFKGLAKRIDAPGELGRHAGAFRDHARGWRSH